MDEAQARIDVKESGVLSLLLKSFEDADVYLRLSALGLCVFCVLCCLICVAWNRYSSVISSVFNSQKKNDLRQSMSQMGGVGQEWTLGRSSSHYIPWQQQAFPLSPETQKLDRATKKCQ